MTMLMSKVDPSLNFSIYGHVTRIDKQITERSYILKALRKKHKEGKNPL